MTTETLDTNQNLDNRPENLNYYLVQFRVNRQRPLIKG